MKRHEKTRGDMRHYQLWLFSPRAITETRRTKRDMTGHEEAHQEFHEETHEEAHEETYTDTNAPNHVRRANQGAPCR